MVTSRNVRLRRQASDNVPMKMFRIKCLHLLKSKPHAGEAMKRLIMHDKTHTTYSAQVSPCKPARQFA